MMHTKSTCPSRAAAGRRAVGTRAIAPAARPSSRVRSVPEATDAPPAQQQAPYKATSFTSGRVAVYGGEHAQCGALPSRFDAGAGGRAPRFVETAGRPARLPSLAGQMIGTCSN